MDPGFALVGNRRCVKGSFGKADFDKTQFNVFHLADIRYPFAGDLYCGHPLRRAAPRPGFLLGNIQRPPPGNPGPDSVHAGAQAVAAQHYRTASFPYARLHAGSSLAAHRGEDQHDQRNGDTADRRRRLHPERRRNKKRSAGTIESPVSGTRRNLYVPGGAALSITATLSKKAIVLSSPAHYMAVYWTCLVTGMTPLVFWTYRGRWSEAMEGGTVRKAMLPAILFVSAVFAAAYAMSLTKVTYVTTVKRLSILFSIILAGTVLKEEYIRERLTGAMLMLSGFALIVLFG